MRKDKPRHNNENQQKKFCNRFGWHTSDGKVRCDYFDGDGITTFDSECMLPWSSRCRDGNIFNCKKLQYEYLASLSEKKREEVIEKYKFH